MQMKGARCTVVMQKRVFRGMCWMQKRADGVCGWFFIVLCLQKKGNFKQIIIAWSSETPHYKNLDLFLYMLTR